MKFAVSSNTDDLLGRIEPRFEKSKYFLVFDMEDLDDYKIISNSNINLSNGDGLEKARLLVEEKIDVLITGSCESAVREHLEKAGIRISDGYYGNVSSLLNNVRIYLKSKKSVEKEAS